MKVELLPSLANPSEGLYEVAEAAGERRPDIALLQRNHYPFSANLDSNRPLGRPEDIGLADDGSELMGLVDTTEGDSYVITRRSMRFSIAEGAERVPVFFVSQVRPNQSGSGMEVLSTQVATPGDRVAQIRDRRGRPLFMLDVANSGNATVTSMSNTAPLHLTAHMVVSNEVRTALSGDANREVVQGTERAADGVSGDGPEKYVGLATWESGLLAARVAKTQRDLDEYREVLEGRGLRGEALEAEVTRGICEEWPYNGSPGGAYYASQFSYTFLMDGQVYREWTRGDTVINGVKISGQPFSDPGVFRLSFGPNGKEQWDFVVADRRSLLAGIR